MSKDINQKKDSKKIFHSPEEVGDSLFSYSGMYNIPVWHDLDINE